VRSLLPLVASLLLALAGTVEAGMARMVVADLPYAPVWHAVVRAVCDYPVERAADGLVRTDWLERAPREGESGFVRIRERATVRVEASGERITRVTVEIEAAGWRDDRWVPIAASEASERAILARIREVLASPGS
jgi:uncharacterized lipoprotein